MSRTRALSPQARMILAVLLDARDGWSHGYELARLAGVRERAGIAPGFLKRNGNSLWRGDDRRGTPTD